MSASFPIIAITGSSGSGTTHIWKEFQKFCEGKKILPGLIEGDSFHKYERQEMRKIIDAWERTAGRGISHFGPEANVLEKLEALFSNFASSGSGFYRKYIHNDDEANRYGAKAGSFTDWQELKNCDLIFYEGLHGGFIDENVNIAKHVDLLIGVTPTINLEWIQKIRRDSADRGHNLKNIASSILRRMDDYVNYIIPQFSRTDVNFQRVPLVDTSNPFAINSEILPEDTLIVVRFKNYPFRAVEKLSSKINGAEIKSKDTLILPGTEFLKSLEVIVFSRILKLTKKARRVKRLTKNE